jgi:hypothetical protein
MAIKYFQWPQNRPNDHKIFQDFPLQDPPKFTQIGIFGLKNKPSGNPDLDHAARAFKRSFVCAVDISLHDIGTCMKAW